MFSFGEFDELEAGQGNFSVWELWLFILVGCMGGLIGACFNRFNQKLSHWRRCVSLFSSMTFDRCDCPRLALKPLGFALHQWCACSVYE